MERDRSKAGWRVDPRYAIDRSWQGRRGHTVVFHPQWTRVTPTPIYMIGEFQCYTKFQHVLKNTNPSPSGPELERQAEEVIRKILTEIPDAHIEIDHQTQKGEWDFVAHVTKDDSHQALVCEVKSRAWPNELHAIAHRLLRGIERFPGNSTPVLIVPYLSPQATEACSDLGLSWADLAGNCELRIAGAYVKVRGVANPYRKGRGTASLYTPKAANVVHALLLDPKRPWKTEELAKEAGVSLGQVASVKRLLEVNNWISSTYGETVLTEPKKLLEDWSQHYRPKRKSFRLFTLDSPATLEKRIVTALSDYAFTEFSAAEKYAPYTRHQRVAIYVSRWDNEPLLGLKGGDGAANVTVYETGEPLRFVEPVKGARCISPVLAYLDLKLLSGRGQDAAEYLLEKAIEPRWK